jgi:hypothetical protein
VHIMLSLLAQYIRRTASFREAAHKILGIHEAATSRVVILDHAYKELAALSVRQDELIRQALRCAENRLFRAAHVMVWAAIMDFIEEQIERKGLRSLKKVRPNWKISSIQDTRELYPEYQIIEAGRDMGLYSRSLCKALHGLLNKRNECAHPSDYFPDLNQTLGYISEIINRIEMILPGKQQSQISV